MIGYERGEVRGAKLKGGGPTLSVIVKECDCKRV